MLYNNGDILRIRKQQRRIVVLSAVFTLIILALFAYFTFYRLLIPAMAISLLWTFSLITVWALYFSASIKYGKLVEGALSGKGLVSAGEFAGSGAAAEIDGHLFIELYFFEAVGKEKYKRKIYYDADYILPDLTAGKMFRYKTLNNFCISLESVD